MVQVIMINWPDSLRFVFGNGWSRGRGGTTVVGKFDGVHATEGHTGALNGHQALPGLRPEQAQNLSDFWGNGGGGFF